MQGEIDWEGIECTKCGNCCPPERCRHFDSVTRLCKVHPEVVGEEVALEKRGFQCGMSPVRLAAEGGYCEPVMAIVKSIVGDKVRIEPEMGAFGFVVVRDWDERVRGELKARGFAWVR